MDPRTSNFFNFLTRAVAKTNSLATNTSLEKKYVGNFMGSLSEIERDAGKHAEQSVAGIEQHLTALYQRLKEINHASDSSEIIFLLHNLNNHLEIIDIQPHYDIKTHQVTYFEYDTHTDIYEKVDAWNYQGYDIEVVDTVYDHISIDGTRNVKYFTLKTQQEVGLNQLSQCVLKRFELFNNPPVIAQQPLSLADKKSQVLHYQASSTMTPEIVEPTFFVELAKLMLISDSDLPIDSFNGLARLKGCANFSACLLKQIEQTLATSDQPEKIRDTIANSTHNCNF